MSTDIDCIFHPEINIHIYYAFKMFSRLILVVYVTRVIHLNMNNRYTLVNPMTQLNLERTTMALYLPYYTEKTFHE